MSFLLQVLALLVLPANCLAAPDGFLIKPISDEFDTLKPMWTPGLRGMPESLTIQNGILSIRSVDNGDDDYPSAEDMITSHADQIGRSLDAIEKPSIAAWVWIPPFAEWSTGTNASGYREWFGLRVIAYDAGMPLYSGLYWPGIYAATDDAGPCFMARVGDGYSYDVTIGRINTPGWWTLGLSWNQEGRTEYYAAPGRITLNQSHLLHTTPISDVPDGNRSLDQLDGTFLALRMTYPSTGQLSPNWMVDSIHVYVRPPPVLGPDFNSDGNSDFLFVKAGTGQTAIWHMNGPSFINAVLSKTVPAGWSIVGTGDFNNDRKPDLLLFNPTSRATAIWYMNGASFISAVLPPSVPAGWIIVGVADFNGDGKPDILFFNPTGRQTAIWYMNGASFIKAVLSKSVPAGWSIAGLGDFNSDGKPDILFLNPTGRQTAIWYMNDAKFMNAVLGPSVAAPWTIAGVADLNSDGKPDILCFNPSTRATVICYMNGPKLVSAVNAPAVPAEWELVAP